ncbi:hypothetical protein DUNSADRAFT_308 [Dunaliella salina]|uniref:Encoded protein n=1 Tax=Dunaliella salina TaxID=3046 RepID=A0ABQ7FZ66_DUNSA|nr:hypothetical protein DUNSADRAFT_308 [Dunaliella salina]|eukprot:KAF5827652.1 hypothetical protein DUNSADRAFT_308 [Dunaliella salina]
MFLPDVQVLEPFAIQSEPKQQQKQSSNHPKQETSIQKRIMCQIVYSTLSFHKWNNSAKTMFSAMRSETLRTRMSAEN